MRTHILVAASLILTSFVLAPAVDAHACAQRFGDPPCGPCDDLTGPHAHVIIPPGGQFSMMQACTSTDVSGDPLDCFALPIDGMTALVQCLQDML